MLQFQVELLVGGELAVNWLFGDKSSRILLLQRCLGQALHQTVRGWFVLFTLLFDEYLLLLYCSLGYVNWRGFGFDDPSQDVLLFWLGWELLVVWGLAHLRHLNLFVVHDDFVLLGWLFIVEIAVEWLNRHVDLSLVIVRKWLQRGLVWELLLLLRGVLIGHFYDLLRVGWHLRSVLPVTGLNGCAVVVGLLLGVYHLVPGRELQFLPRRLRMVFVLGSKFRWWLVGVCRLGWDAEFCLSFKFLFGRQCFPNLCYGDDRWLELLILNLLFKIFLGTTPERAHRRPLRWYLPLLCLLTLNRIGESCLSLLIIGDFCRILPQQKFSFRLLLLCCAYRDWAWLVDFFRFIPGLSLDSVLTFFVWRRLYFLRVAQERGQVGSGILLNLDWCFGLLSLPVNQVPQILKLVLLISLACAGLWLFGLASLLLDHVLAHD